MSWMSLVALGPLIQVSGARVEAGERLRHRADDVAVPDNDHMAIRHQAQGPATLTESCVEDEGAGLAGRDGTGRDHRVDVVQLVDHQGLATQVGSDLGEPLIRATCSVPSASPR